MFSLSKTAAHHNEQQPTVISSGADWTPMTLFCLCLSSLRLHNTLQTFWDDEFVKKSRPWEAVYPALPRLLWILISSLIITPIIILSYYYQVFKKSFWRKRINAKNIPHHIINCIAIRHVYYILEAPITIQSSNIWADKCICWLRKT